MIDLGPSLLAGWSLRWTASTTSLEPEDATTLANTQLESLDEFADAPFNDQIDAAGERIFDDRVTGEPDE